MTREELQSAIQDFWDEAFHCSKHEISDTSKAIALECMMDAAERKRTCHSTNADRIRGMDDNELADFIDRCEAAGYNDSSVALDKNNNLMDTLDWLQQPAEEERNGIREYVCL